MKKTVAFKSPMRTPNPADAWVSERGEAPEIAAPKLASDDQVEPMKRLTIDVPAGLHTRMKIGCAMRGLKMADVMREFLEREFPTENSKSVKS